MVVEATKLDRRFKSTSSLLKSENVVAIEFGSLSERDVITWVNRQARSHQLQLGRDVASYLVDSTGTALRDLDHARYFEAPDMHPNLAGHTRIAAALHEVVVDLTAQ